MVTIVSLWLPIILATVGVFFTSYLMWMVLPHHKNDFGKVPDEDGLMDALRAQGAGPGQYVFPCAETNEQMKDPDFQKKYAEGPAGMLIIRPSGGFNMGKSMAQSTTFNLAVSVCVAYVATFTLTSASTSMEIFRLTGTVAFLAYAGALGWGAIWWGHRWSSTFKGMADGLAYGVVTGLVFMLLWP